MHPNPFLYVGFNRRVAALDRATGAIIWQWKAPKGHRYVTVHLDGDLLIIAVDGYMYGLDPHSGEERWFNPMSGFGMGVTSIATSSGSTANLSAMAVHRQAKNHSESSVGHSHSPASSS